MVFIKSPVLGNMFILLNIDVMGLLTPDHGPTLLHLFETFVEKLTLGSFFGSVVGHEY